MRQSYTPAAPDDDEPPRPMPPERPRVYEFVVTDHIHHVEMGRILRRSDGKYVCADCEAESKRLHKLCCCGLPMAFEWDGPEHRRPKYSYAINRSPWAGQLSRIICTFDGEIAHPRVIIEHDLRATAISACSAVGALDGDPVAPRRVRPPATQRRVLVDRRFGPRQRVPVEVEAPPW
jgi:hypothetical protein